MNSAIEAWREQVLLSLFFHLAALVLVLIVPRLSFVQELAERRAERLQELAAAASLQALLPQAAPPDAGRLFEAALDALTIPGSFPAFSAIEVDLLGYLWVREYNLPGEADRALWTVFDPEGVALGFVETPPELVIYEIGDDYILGKTTDELGVEYVQLWGLDRSG